MGKPPPPKKKKHGKPPKSSDQKNVTDIEKSSEYDAYAQFLAFENRQQTTTIEFHVEK